MPNSCWINRARRGPVHNSVPNPCSVGFSQPTEDDLLLGSRQLGGTARDGAGAQPLCAGSPEAGEPTPNRSRIDVEGLGDLLGGGSFEDAADGEGSSMVQFLR